VGATRDIAISVAGATIVGLAVYAVDKYLATKQAASIATTSAPDLSAGGYVQAEELAAQFSGVPTNSNLAGTTGVQTAAAITAANTTPPTTAQTIAANAAAALIPPPPTPAQILIAKEQANLASLAQNSVATYNRPISTVVQ
jgi:hypothetical protein